MRVSVYVMENAPGKTLAKWKRTSLVGTDDLSVWFPVGAFGNEDLMLLKAVYDGQPVLWEDGHVFAGSGWLESERPDIAQGIQNARAHMLKVHAGQVAVLPG